MYISIPKNYGGNAFPHASAVGQSGLPRPVPPFSDFGAPSQLPMGGHRPLPPSSEPCPRDPPPSSSPSCAPPREDCDPRDADASCGRCELPPPCAERPPCRTENKNPLTCLFEALRCRKKSGFDADDFLLIGLIALLMGKTGSEDIVLILALLLLV